MVSFFNNILKLKLSYFFLKFVLELSTITITSTRPGPVTSGTADDGKLC